MGVKRKRASGPCGRCCAAVYSRCCGSDSVHSTCTPLHSLRSLDSLHPVNSHEPVLSLSLSLSCSLPYLSLSLCLSVCLSLSVSAVVTNGVRCRQAALRFREAFAYQALRKCEDGPRQERSLSALSALSSLLCVCVCVGYVATELKFGSQV